MVETTAEGTTGCPVVDVFGFIVLLGWILVLMFTVVFGLMALELLIDIEVGLGLMLEGVGLMLEGVGLMLEGLELMLVELGLMLVELGPTLTVELVFVLAGPVVVTLLAEDSAGFAVGFFEVTKNKCLSN